MDNHRSVRLWMSLLTSEIPSALYVTVRHDTATSISVNLIVEADARLTATMSSAPIGRGPV